MRDLRISKNSDQLIELREIFFLFDSLYFLVLLFVVFKFKEILKWGQRLSKAPLNIAYRLVVKRSK